MSQQQEETERLRAQSHASAEVSQTKIQELEERLKEQQEENR